MEILLSALGGLVGGNGTGAASKANSLGTIGNSIAGAVGGLGGGLLANGLLDNVAMAANTLVGGGIGGVVLTFIVGFIKKKMAGSSTAS